MFGLKIFVQVQTFRRVPPVLPRNFCHPEPEQDVIGLSTHLTRQTATMSEGVAEETSCLPGDPLHRPSCKYTNQPTSMAIRNLEQQVSI